MNIPDFKSKDLYCPNRHCKGELLHCDAITTDYHWAIPLKCNRCKTVRFMCKSCVSHSIIGGNYILHKRYLWRHNMSHIKKKDLSEKESNSIANIKGLVLTDDTPSAKLQSEVQKDVSQKRVLVENKSDKRSRDFKVQSEQIDICNAENIHRDDCVNCNFTSHIDIVADTLDIVHVQNKDSLLTVRSASASTPLVLSTGCDIENKIRDIYDNKASYEYFQKNASHDKKDTGPAFLVGQAVTGTNSAHKSMNKNDIALHLLLAKFTATLTVDQKHQFTLILKLIMNKNIEESDGNTSMEDGFPNYKNGSIDKTKNSIIKTRYPHDVHTIRRYYHEGVKSIVMNLPQPKITLVDNHAYVSVRQCIADFFGNGFYPQQPSSKTTAEQKKLTNCVLMKDITERAIKSNPNISHDDIIILLAVQWSDDFEPNTSSKTNRGSVWLKTITFVSNTFSSNDLANTYPISIGLKSLTHDVVEERFLNECKDLAGGKGNQFYSTHKKRNINVHFEIIASLGDQPERRSMNYMMLGNSIFCSRFRFSANLKEIYQHMPSCNRCFTCLKKDVKFDNVNTSCEKCVNWELMRNSVLTRFNPPKDYPLEKEDRNQYLTPIEITFESLRKCIEVSTQKFRDGMWNSNNVTAYCNVNGINTNGTQLLMKTLQNCRALEYVDANINKHEVGTHRNIVRDYNKNNNKYTVWKGGPYWQSGLQLNQFVDALMHLIFLGVTKATMSLISKWLVATLRPKEFTMKHKSVFHPIIVMGLDWCKLIDTDSGWVSDNYLGFARIMKWYYYPLYLVKYDGKRVYDNSTKNEGYYQNNSTDIHECIASWVATISYAMKKEVNLKETPILMKRQIKLFLTGIHNIDINIHMNSKYGRSKKIGKEKDYVPYWITKYNYQSLLNLPDTMHRYGPLVNLWEGSNQGEGYLRYAKPMIVNIHSKNWQINAIQKLQNKKALNTVVDYHMVNDCDDLDMKASYFSTKRERHAKMYETYRSVNELFTNIRRQLPISCIGTTEGKYYAIVQKTDIDIAKGVEIKFNFQKKIDILSICFHNIAVDMNMTDYSLECFRKEIINQFILLLPEMETSGYKAGGNMCMYYVINSEWNELDENLVFSTPRTPGCIY